MTVSFEEYSKMLEKNTKLIEMLNMQTEENNKLIEMLNKQVTENKKLVERINEQKNLVLENKRLNILVENMQLQLNSLQKMIFGAKREQTPASNLAKDIVNGTQCSMFEKNELDRIEDDENFKKELKESRKELMAYKKKNNRNRKRKARRN